MKRYQCDNCNEIMREPAVKIKGYAGQHGILLPEHLQKHEFCSPECFEKWVRGRLHPEPKQ